MVDTQTTKTEGSRRRILKAAIVGGGKGCVSVLEMVRGDTLGRFRMTIDGVADLDPDAPGMLCAKECGVKVVTTHYQELFDIPGLDLIIELTGSDTIRDEIERERPRHIRLIDHFGARLFWELHQAEEAIIAQRNDTQIRIETERERISQIFDCIPDEILVVDTEMAIKDANLAFLRNNKVTLDEIRDQRCYEVDQKVRGECQVAVGNCPFAEVTQNGKPKSVVRKHFTDDGEIRFAAIVSAPLLDRNGRLVGMIEMTRDITHRIRLEEELKVTEIRLQQFLENAPLSTFVKNRSGQYVEANPALCRLLEREKNEIIGKTDYEILPRDAAEVFRKGDRDVLNQGSYIEIDQEVTLQCKRRFLNTIKYPVTDQAGKVNVVCGIMADVTPQREAQAELVRMQEYLQNILDNSPALIITTDLESKIVSFNKGAEACLGYKAEEVIGRGAAEFYENPEDRFSLLRRVIQSGSARDQQTNLLHKDGHSVPVSITLSQLRNSEGEMIGTVGISKDVSHRRVLMDQIIQSERMAAVGRLAAGVAHEINNPLAVISEIAGYLHDLASGGPGSNENDLFNELLVGLPKIEKQVRRGRSITSRLLSLARKTEARLTSTAIDASLDEILPFLEKEARLNNVEIHRECDAQISPVYIEEIQLQEVFINLIQNAVQAVSSKDKGNVWISCSQEGKRVTVSIRDDGPGISDEIKDRLFDPFVTTKPFGKGTGLGLSICYGIVKRYDGEIRVYSNEQGATFDVILPAASSEISQTAVEKKA
jgi:PAS domain S-box-containing protein